MDECMVSTSSVYTIYAASQCKLKSDVYAALEMQRIHEIFVEFSSELCKDDQPSATLVLFKV